MCYLRVCLFVFVLLRQKFPLSVSEDLKLILLAQWAPVGNGIAFVLHDNLDIYYKSTPESTAYRVTNTGLPTVIYNGVPDWVNEGIYLLLIYEKKKIFF